MKIALDFDGVLHSDTQGIGSGDFIPDPPVEGAMKKLDELLRHPQVEQVFIFSLRCAGQHGLNAMGNWITTEYRKEFATQYWGPAHLPEHFSKLQFALVKPQVDMYIDDRNLEFRGDWNDPKFSIEALLAFKPWNR